MDEEEERFQLLRAMYCPESEYLKIPEGSAPPSSRRGPLKPTWYSFQIMLYHSEYDLAWDILYELGSLQSLPIEFWEEMVHIAEIMEDSERGLKAKTMIP
jgi:hypothetical protein